VTSNSPYKVIIVYRYTYCTVKNFGGKKVWKRLLQRIGEKNFGKCWLRQSSISNKAKLNESIQTSMNIIKQTPYCSGFVLCHMLVACCSMMVRHTVESMNYHKYISKLSLESELDLLKYCSIDILTSIFTQNKLNHTSCCCMRLMLQKWKWAKKLANCCDLPNLPKFFPLQSFLLYGICLHVYLTYVPFA